MKTMRRLLALVALVLAGNIGTAHAATITFEDLLLDQFGTGGDRTSGGYFFDTALNHSHIDNGTGGWGTTNGTQFMMVDNVTSNPNGINNTIRFSPTGGGPFALTSIDLSEAGSVFDPGVYTSSSQILITGNLFGGGSPISKAVTLNPVLPFGFETVSFNSDWNNLASVVLEGVGATCCGATAASSGQYFAIDNVVVNSATPVPEPGTLSLVGLGCASLIARRRCNRR